MRDYIRAMLMILWVAVRHPFDTTVIDVETGECWPGTKPTTCPACGQQKPVKTP